MRAVEVTVRITVPPEYAPGEDPEWFEGIIEKAFWDEDAVVDAAVIDIEEV